MENAIRADTALTQWFDINVDWLAEFIRSDPDFLRAT